VTNLMNNHFLTALLAIILVLQGCTSQVMGPKSQATPGERLSDSEEKTVVFLRMKASIKTRLFEEVPLMSRPDEKGFGISLKPQGGSATPVLVQLHRIDPAEIGQKGWLYFSSVPDNYELEFIQNYGEGQKAFSFILRVPPQKSAVYAGSVHFSCLSKGGFWGPTLGEMQGIKVTDEGKPARNMVEPLFGESGQVFVSILEGKEWKRILPASTQSWFPMGLVVASTNDMVSPDWTKRGIARATGIGAIPGEQIARAVLDGGAGLGLAYLLYLPVGATIGAISGKAAESKWRPCLEGLSKELDKIEPAAMLRPKLVQELTKYGPSQPVALAASGDFSGEARRNGLKTVLQAEIQRIQLRECQERGSFCVELALRVRLWEANNHTPLKEKILLYSNLHPYRTYSETLQPHEVATWASSPCRRMEVYCGPEGDQVLRQEINAGLDSLVEKLCFELGLLSM
jgi:hypothetical protein